MEPTLLDMAGPMGLLILALGGLGVLVTLALTGAAVTQRRVPLTAWLAVPMLILAAGAFASWTQTGSIIDEAATAGAGMSATAAAGLAKAWAPDYLARWVGAGVLLLGAWGASAGAIRVGKYALWTAFAGIMTLVSALIFSIMVAGFGNYYGLGGGVYLVAAMLFLGGIGLGAAAMRRAYHEEAHRVAGMRFTAAILYFMGVFQAARGLILGVRMDIYQAQATVVPQDLAELVASQLAFLSDVNTVGAVAISGAFVAACFAFFAELGEVVQKYTVWDTFAAAVLLVLVIGVRVIENTGTTAVQEVALLKPMPELIAELGYDLPPGAAAIKGEFYDAHFEVSGFGDAIIYEEGAWIRKWAWTGRGWDRDDSPIDKVALYKGAPVLIAIESAEQSQALLDVLETLGGEAILLLRAGELDSEAPKEAAHLQGTLLPLKLSTEADRDLASQLWVDGDKYDLYYGPIRAFGEGADERDIVRRLDAAYAVNEGTSSLHIAAGPRTRVSHIAELCVAAKVVPVEEESEDLAGKDAQEVMDAAFGTTFAADMPKTVWRLLPREGFCAATTEEYTAFIEAGIAAVELPAPANVTVRQRVENADPSIEAVLARELPAFGWCQHKVLHEAQEAIDAAAAEGEEPAEGEPAEAEELQLPDLTGAVLVQIDVDKRGRAGEFSWDEDNIDSRALQSCIKDRIDRARFPVIEEPEGVEPVKDQEPPPPRRIQLTLDYTSPS